MPARLFTAFFSSVLLSLSASAANLDQYLVARWTFNKGTLVSDKGGFVFKSVEFGRDPSLVFADGAIALGPGLLLVCDKINSTANPELAQAITIWARVRVDETPTLDNFFFGLRDEEMPGDWKNMVFGVLSRSAPANGTGFFAHLPGSIEFGSGSRMATVAPGRYVSMALVFDGATKSATYLVDGQTLVNRHKDAVSLDAFGNFAIGRLKASGAALLTFDEVRIYSVALSPEWIADITPVK